MCRERGPQLNRVCQNGFKTSHFMIFLYADKIIPVKKKKRKFTEKRDNCMSIILEYTRGVPKWRNFFFSFLHHVDLSSQPRIKPAPFAVEKP